MARFRQGFTVRDRFSGVSSPTPRLNTLPETKLGRALIGSQPVLIAPDPAGGSIGVEIRNTAVDLEADSRLCEQRSSLRSAGVNLWIRSP